MKIGVVTFWGGYNYGSTLQGFALQRVLETHFNAKATILRLDKNLITPVPRSCFHYLYNPLQKIKIRHHRSKSVKKGYDNIEKYREAYENNKVQFKRFEEKINYSDIISTPIQLKECNSDFDFFIAGSDQIWNPSILRYCYFLDFVLEANKKISYAPSLGTATLPFYTKNQYKQLLSDFNHISVREKKSAIMLSKLLNKKVAHVLDPTLLLSKEYWHEQANYSLIPKFKYVLCYFLSDNPCCYREAEKFASKKGLKILSIVAGVSGGYDIKDAIIIPEVGPQDFLGLIENAEYVLTNSFHCTVFSIIFKKEFFCFSGISYSSLTNVNFRYIDLLETFNLEERYVGNNLMEQLHLMKPIDYDKVDSILKQLKKDSIDFLAGALINNTRK